MKPYIEKLIDYNYWANGLILKFAEQLTGEEFLQVDSYSHNSIRDVLTHVMFAEWLWLDRMQGRSRVQDEYKRFFNPEKYHDTKTLYGAWFDLELRMREYLAGLSEKQLIESFKYQRSDESEFENRRIDVFTQLAFHGMQHRAELAMMLTKLGHSPGNIDFIAYLRP